MSGLSREQQQKMSEATNDTNQPFELKFTGTDIHPEAVRARDLAEVIESFDEMVSTSVLAENTDLRREDLVISFVHIEDGSVKLQFLPNLRPVALAALQTVAVAVSSGDYQHVPNQAVKCMKTIQTFTKRHNCVAEIREAETAPQPIATISPDTEITERPLIEGKTELFGEILRVGGKTPRVMFQEPRGRVIYCTASYDVAKELGQDLYSWVTIMGTAKWNPEDLTVEEFAITELTSAPTEPVTSTVGQIAQLCRAFYEDVTDVPAYVASVRGTEMEGV